MTANRLLHFRCTFEALEQRLVFFTFDALSMFSNTSNVFDAKLSFQTLFDAKLLDHLDADPFDVDTFDADSFDHFDADSFDVNTFDADRFKHLEFRHFRCRRYRCTFDAVKHTSVQNATIDNCNYLANVIHTGIHSVIRCIDGPVLQIARLVDHRSGIAQAAQLIRRICGSF